MNSNTYSFHYKQNLKLSFPIILGQLSQIFIILSDTLMVGNYSATSLAAATFANALFFVFLSFGMGFTFGIKPPVANAHAANKPQKSKNFLKHGMILYTGLAFLMYGFLELMIPFLHLLDQPKEVYEIAIPYFRIIGISIIPFIIGMGLIQFVEALSHTKLPMIVNVLANITNVILNYAFIYGVWGFPQWGLLGAGWATLVARTAVPLVIVICLFTLPKLKFYTQSFFKIKLQGVYFEKLLKIGLPIAFQTTFEVVAFVMAAIMVGWVGTFQLAAHQVALSISIVSYLISMGLSQGTTIHVANQLGAGKKNRVARAGNSSIFMVIVFMFFASLLILSTRHFLPTLFVSENDLYGAEMVELAAYLLLFVSIYQFSDGIQVVSLGALRGLEDVKIPTIITFFAYWVVAIPLGYFLGIYKNWGAEGIWIGLSVGLTISAFLLAIRFQIQSKKIKL